MVNLFRRAPADQGGLTAALLALLEHADRALLDDFLHIAGLGGPPPAAAELTFRLPEEGPGVIAGPEFQVRLVAEAPGEPLPADAVTPGTIAVTLAGRAPEGAAGLSWEQVDRWVNAAASRYDADSRTGFLLAQFQDFVRESGIAFFAGFGPGQPEASAAAYDTFSDFLVTVASFFERLGPAVAGLPGGGAELRQSRAEDVLGGYVYRDYAGPLLAPDGFLRVAFHLPQGQLQTSLWLSPGLSPQSPHGRLRTALLEDEAFRTSLQELEGEAQLWFWSQAGEQKVPLRAFAPELVEGLNWSEYQVGVQTALGFAEIGGEGLVGRVAERLSALSAALGAVRSGPVH